MSTNTDTRPDTRVSREKFDRGVYASIAALEEIDRHLADNARRDKAPNACRRQYVFIDTNGRMFDGLDWSGAVGFMIDRHRHLAEYLDTWRAWPSRRWWRPAAPPAPPAPPVAPVSNGERVRRPDGSLGRFL